MNANQYRRQLFALAIAIPCMVAVGHAANAEEFYAGKTINIVVGGSSGGGHDTYARTIARHLPRYIPGSPTVVVRNMPGAGSTKAAGFLYGVAPKDGTTIAAVYPGAIVGPLLDDRIKASLFDPTKFQYIGSAESGARVCATYQSSKVKSFSDALKQQSVFGASAPGGAAHDYAQMVKKATGAVFRIVGGYRASLNMALDMERGQIDGICGWDWSTVKAQKPDWLREKKLNLLVQIGLEPDKELVDLAVPSLFDFVKNEDDLKAVRLVLSQQVFGRPYLAPPETPLAQVEVLRAAYAATMKDKEFLAETTKSRLDISPIGGAQLQALVKSLYGTPKATVDRAKNLMKP